MENHLSVTHMLSLPQVSRMDACGAFIRTGDKEEEGFGGKSVLLSTYEFEVLTSQSAVSVRKLEMW